MNTWVCIGGFELLHWSAGILNERCEYYENNLSFYNDFLEVPLTNCDTVERDFWILQDVSRETSTSILFNLDGGSLELDFNSGRGGTVEKTKDHSLEVREQVKNYENIDISKIDYQIEREGLRF